MNVVQWADVDVNGIAFDIGVKLVFSNIILNPIFYGVCRSNYRKGYGYVLHMFAHYLFCGLVKRPGGKEICRISYRNMSHLYFWNKIIVLGLPLIVLKKKNK